MGVLSQNVGVVQIILYVCYGVYIALGITAVILGSITVARVGIAGIGVGVLTMGGFMLLLGALAVYASREKNWFLLFVIELVNIAVLVVLFVFSVQLLILGTGRDDPITDSVLESWNQGFRTDLESSAYCRTCGASSCDDFYYHFYLRDEISSAADSTGEYYCPGIDDADRDFYASNCTKFGDLPLCKELMTTECVRCDEECRDIFIDDMKSYMVPVAIVFWGLIALLTVQIVWNNIIINTAEDSEDFYVEGTKQLISHVLNGIVFIFGFLVMVLGLVSMGLVNRSCPEGESCVGWTSSVLSFLELLSFAVL